MLLLTAEQCRGLIKPLLTEKRYQHSLYVAQEAVSLADRFGCCKEKAEQAGLLHDIMKNSPPEEQLKLIENFGIMLSETERASKAVWHQISGAVYLRQVVGVQDEDLLRAVRYHTTGRKGMSLLEKIVFVADAVSQDRHYDGVEEIRAALCQGLDQAVAVNTACVIRSFVEKRLPVVEDTVEAYNSAVLALRGAETQAPND
jgi:predicted HD superfamily hydrolase involved in NAD metabolism